MERKEGRERRGERENGREGEGRGEKEGEGPDQVSREIGAPAYSASQAPNWIWGREEKGEKGGKVGPRHAKILTTSPVFRVLLMCMSPLSARSYWKRIVN